MAKEVLGEKTANVGKQMLKAVASHYANVACPIFTYQPKVDENVKKLRKF